VMPRSGFAFANKLHFDTTKSKEHQREASEHRFTFIYLFLPMSKLIIAKDLRESSTPLFFFLTSIGFPIRGRQGSIYGAIIPLGYRAPHHLFREAHCNAIEAMQQCFKYQQVMYKLFADLHFCVSKHFLDSRNSRFASYSYMLN
jgi:hypothetical protein